MEMSETGSERMERYRGCEKRGRVSEKRSGRETGGEKRDRREGESRMRREKKG